MRCKRSARLTALATTSTTTSSGAGCGSGTSAQPRTSTSPAPLVVTAHMRRTLVPRLVIQHNDRMPKRQIVVESDTSDAALYRRVERTVPKLARTMIDTFVAEIPLYGFLPREQLEGEILGITTANLRL